VNSFLLVFLAVIGAAEAQKQDAHIRITFFIDKMPRKVQLVIGLLGFLLGVVFCAVMTWRGILLASDAYEYSERVSSSLGTPMVFPYGLLPVGFGALALQFLINAVQTVLEWNQPGPALRSSDG
jgi:TRAP-type C4-dicarboxylate transport system permease small subunit